MKKILFKIPVTILMLLPSLVIAPRGLPGGPDQTPIDGGLGILAAVGGAYAIKKLRERKN